MIFPTGANPGKIVVAEMDTADTAGTQPRYRAWQSDDGIDLSVTLWEPKQSTAIDVLCLPGLSRNARDFAPLARYLTGCGHRVVAMDYRGRGHSGRHPDWRTYSIECEAKDIDTGLAALSLARVAVVGTSRGGLHGMLLAWRAPDRVAGLVLNDIGPEIERSGLKRISGEIGRHMRADTWQEAAERLRTGLGSQFPRVDAQGWLRLARQLYVETDDGIQLDYDARLANTLGSFDEDAELPDLWPVFDAIASLPMLAIRGAHSDILSAETFSQMKQRSPGLERHTIADEGHAPLLWDAETQGVIARFLSRLR